MKIAYVCTDPGVPVFGNKGGSIHVQSVVRALMAQGAEVVLYARRIGGEPPAGLDTVRVCKLTKAPRGQTPEREQFLLDANRQVRELLAGEAEWDLVYERHALFSFAAMEYARKAGIPGLLEVNAPLVEEQQRFRTLSLVDEAEHAATRCFAAASGLLAVSRPLATWLSRRPEAAGRVHIVPNGVDVERFGPGVLPTLPDHAGRVTIGFVGSLRPWHGVEQLVEAFVQLRQEGLPLRLLIVGDGPMREQIEQMCASQADSVVFTGAVPLTDIPGLIASMDIAAAPYPRMEGFYFSPLKLYEYMAGGVSIVASALGQVCEVIDHEQTGLLYEPGNVPALCGTIRRLAQDPNLRAMLGSNARAKACRDHRWECVASKILQLARAHREVPA